MIDSDKSSRRAAKPVSDVLSNSPLIVANPLYTLSILGLLSLVWLLLAGQDWNSWLVGLPAVILATWSTLLLRAPAEGRFNLPGFLRFLPYFIWESILGGIDVASRVVSPKMRIAPGFLSYRMRLSHPSARRLFVNSLSLLPGTLAADLDGDSLHIHALDRGTDPDGELKRLERMVSAVYGEDL
ncbi:MAG: Na+/H+ antiporter subunit E [Candidatus Thiodiazotropha sp. (ex Ctena orbiculata)]|nr:Na+/H+ antiporter subunit E [Candidatus Thiodiazotropha taylori]